MSNIDVKKIQQAFKDLDDFYDYYEKTYFPLKKRILYSLARIILIFQEKAYKKGKEITFIVGYTNILVSEYVREGLKKETLYRIGPLEELRSTIKYLEKVNERKLDIKIKKLKFLKNMYYTTEINYFNEKEWQEKIRKAEEKGEVITITL